MTAPSGKGTGMHLDTAWVRLAYTRKSGPIPGLNATLTHDHIPEIRRLLRTEMSIAEIAVCFDVDMQTLRSFIKRRQICNLTNRKNFISLQRSIAKLDSHGNKIRQHSSDGEQPLCRRKRADSSPAAGTIPLSSESSPDGTATLVSPSPTSARVADKFVRAS